MSLKTWNNTGFWANAKAIWTLNDDSLGTSASVVELVNGDTITPDGGVTANTSGTYGYGFNINADASFNSNGYTLTTGVNFQAGAGGWGVTGWTIFVALNAFTTSVTSGTLYLFSQSKTVVGANTIRVSSAAPTTPVLAFGSVSEVTGNAGGTNAAFNVVGTGAYGTSQTWTLYQNGASVGTPATLTNTGSNVTVQRLGGVTGQAKTTAVSVFCIAIFEGQIGSTDMATLVASLTGSGNCVLWTTAAAPPSQANERFASPGIACPF